MAKKTNILAWIITILVTVGALAWGVYGITGFFPSGRFLLVDFLVSWSWLANVIYILVGLAGILLIPTVLAMIFGKKR
jgi:uncharacterized membrane protein YuzA (DUF378 family)